MIGVLSSRKRTKVHVWYFDVEMTTSKKPKIS